MGSEANLRRTEVTSTLYSIYEQNMHTASLQNVPNTTSDITTGNNRHK